jgi:hypothetical protein
MITISDLLRLPYTPDLTDGGIAYALHSLPYLYNRAKGSSFDALRRVAAGAAVQLAFRRYLSEQTIPFEVKGALPFTEHDRYDVFLGGRRCDIQSFLIHDPDQISAIQRSPQVLLQAPALVPSDLHAGDGHSQFDLYLFAFLAGQVAAAGNELANVIEAKPPYSLVHLMAESWNRPRKWNPLGTLALKSEAEETQTLEIGGQDEGRGLRSCLLKLPPRTRVELPNGFFSLSYAQIHSIPRARIGIYSPVRRETYLIGARDWGNLWIYGREVVLAGYMTRDEFSRRAHSIQPGSYVIPYDAMHSKNLAVPVSDLKPLSELFERANVVSTARSPDDAA